MDDIVAFLAARYDEEEETARLAPDKRVYMCEDDNCGHSVVEPEEQWADGSDRLPNHHATWALIYDPARVLAEVAAKRAILTVHVPERRRVSFHDGVGFTNFGDLVCVNCYRPQVYEGEKNPWWPCTTLRALGAVHADHPDYRDEWRP